MRETTSESEISGTRIAPWRNDPTSKAAVPDSDDSPGARRYSAERMANGTGGSAGAGFFPASINDCSPV